MHITLSFPAASVKGEVWSVTKHSACEVKNIPHCSAQWRLPHPGPAETDLPASLRGHPPSLVASPPPRPPWSVQGVTRSSVHLDKVPW